MKQSISNDQLKDFLDSDDFSGIVQKNSDKFKEIWTKWAQERQVIHLDKQISWNWIAFFCSEFWFLYRKMYKLFWIFVACRLVLTLLPLLLPDLGTSFSNIIFALSLLSGALGNTWYLKKCILLAKVAKENFQSGAADAKKSFFEANAGTAPKYVWIYAIVAAIYTAIMIGALYPQ